MHQADQTEDILERYAVTCMMLVPKTGEHGSTSMDRPVGRSLVGDDAPDFGGAADASCEGLPLPTPLPFSSSLPVDPVPTPSPCFLSVWRPSFRFARSVP